MTCCAQRRRIDPMQKRDFLAAAGLIGLGVRPACAQDAVPRLGQPWQVPAGANIELKLEELGLSLSDALATLARWRIAGGARVTLRIPDGRHAQGRAVDIDHPDGARLAIVGNMAQPERCRLFWTGASEGIYAGAGCTLGLLDGVVLEQVNPAGRGLGSGVLADLGGVVRCGPHVVVRGFYYGYQARFGGVISCKGSRCEAAGDAGYFAYQGGHIMAQGTQSQGARDTAQSLGSGYVAEYGGTIDASDSSARGNLLAGYTALSNGSIRAHKATAEQNGKAGFLADTGGTIVAHDGLARANCGSGLLARERPSAIVGERLRSIDNGSAVAACSM